MGKIIDLIPTKITPRRFDILVWTLILWFIWLNPSDFKQLPSLQFNIPFGISFNASDLPKPVFLKFFGAGIFSVISHISLHIYVKEYLGFLKTKDPEEVKNLLKLLEERAGIKKIYEGKTGEPAIHQSYVIDMMNELAHTRSLKILSIAGYESIGKGEGKSLFYDSLRSNNINLEYILLSPTDDVTIDERINQLKMKDHTYTNKELKDQINKTIERLRTLKLARGDDSIKGYFCKFHPIFRLFIFDRCLFMSTYEVDRHGHESPVYKIDKVNDNDPAAANLSLYETYSNFFEKIKKNSNPIRL